MSLIDFNKLTKEEKIKLQKSYRKLLTWRDELEKSGDEDAYPIIDCNSQIFKLEELFGKENFQPEPEIKTWKDVEKEHPEYFKSHNTPNPMLIPSQELRDNLLNKSIAMYKIATLIELGYGGVISEGEWQKEINKDNGFYVISWNIFYKSFQIHYETNSKSFLSFRTRELAEEFMHYPENVELLRQFNML